MRSFDRLDSVSIDAAVRTRVHRLITDYLGGQPVPADMIVTTAVGGSPEIVDEGVTGHLAPSQDPAALADAMVRMCQRRDVWGAIGCAGRARVEKYFNVRTMVTSYERLYEELLVSNGASR